ncbi:MAG TPA: LPS export ABC transporter periplasmic protein LptC [Bacteroidales bacterium]|nr:LPS export ABC transporter periplasmic protein LptC [Bacteroidales bacterium]
MIIIIAMLFACKNKMSEIVSLDFNDTIPDISAKDIEFTFSDSAMVQIRLSGPVMYAYEGEDSYMEFPEGFRVEFYDSAFNITSTITGKYGIHFTEKKIMEARKNVVVTNYETGERLDTEELIWDQNKEVIYSNKFVKITSGDGVIYGDGMEAEQDFSKRRIINPSGEIEVKEEEGGS